MNKKRTNIMHDLRKTKNNNIDTLEHIKLQNKWSVKDGDYEREKYEYDVSHDEILKKEKREKLIWNIVFFVIAFGVITGILWAMTSV